MTDTKKNATKPSAEPVAPAAFKTQGRKAFELREAVKQKELAKAGKKKR